MISRLLSLARTSWTEIAASTLLRLCSQLAMGTLIIFPLWVLKYSPDLSLWLVALVMASMALVAATSRWGEQVCGHRAAFSLLAQLRVQLYDALIRRGLPASSAGSGSIMSIATRDINSIEVFFAHTIAPAITAFVLSLGTIISLLVFSPIAGILGVLGILIAWSLPFLGKQPTQSEAAVRGAIAQHLSEDAAGRLEINSHGAQQHRLSQLNAKEENLLGVVTTHGFNIGIRQGVALIWPWIIAVLMLVLVPENSLIAAALILALSPALDAVEGFARTLPTALGSAERFFTIIDAPVAVPEPTSPKPLPTGPLSVEFRDVVTRFQSASQTPFSLKIPAGEHLGIVGPSGVGKSTLAASLLKVALPHSGSILLGGVNIQDITTQHLRNAVCLVEQRAVLFKGSVLSNLRMGNPELSEEQAREALRLASISEITLDADALKLSGGQQQRLCLARALARNPQVLVVDEATSHQDALNQAELAQTLAGLDITIIIIAHRREALSHVDRIIDMVKQQRP